MGMTAKLNSSARRKGNKNNVIPFNNTKHTSSVILAIFKDIVTLKGAAAELKNINIKLRSISIGLPKINELEKLELPQNRVYAFFALETINNKVEKTYQSIVEKYQGFVLDNKIVIN